MIGEDLKRFQACPERDDVTGELLDGRVVLERERCRDGLRRVDPRDAGAGYGEQEVLKPRAAAHFAICDNLETDAFLQPDRIRNRRVFQILEL